MGFLPHRAVFCADFYEGHMPITSSKPAIAGMFSFFASGLTGQLTGLQTCITNAFMLLGFLLPLRALFRGFIAATLADKNSGIVICHFRFLTNNASA
jgi:hypothetical protein